MPLPREPCDTARLLLARVDTKARVSVRQCTYSVCRPTIEILHGATVVARHERAVGKFLDVLTLDHYLEVLKTKPGALPGATAP